ncbi:methyltransferase domain-containing protein [Actinoalloteichus hymeniacidonis]|uniref:Protein-L-isoaspartate O-methyltransferase n=1 Tax=Actinoalloteichus hymeniacidonis TaxID=340345 RepID=A0AAC9HPW4_9PSEU|nr:methyltransferase domain-containing protein [Actinoalloteichus hymeniacidonis]AOS63352.1 protein-L-isoaspartate carboxylmethyltransferase [Actinoalloteichus hymeniacidonis]MBB5908608.1 protein-L-isoaspartate O-methyltransferase [Actinoalloteichus hymeniacidonis]
MTTVDIREKFVSDLVSAGHLADPAWSAAFRAIPREVFVDDFSVASPGSAALMPIKIDDPGRLAHVYSDTTLVTELDADGTPVSSSTAPGLMALMLAALDVQDGHRVLEIGTGTGYNAALVSHRLGAESVVSIDIDPDLVTAARTRLATLGLKPLLVAGDGAAGVPGQEPFDRLITTCGLDHIPAAWLRQVRPGGLILVNLGFTLVRLTVNADGTAHGPILADQAGFMPRRSSVAETAVPSQLSEPQPQDATAPLTDTMPLALDVPNGRALLSISLPGLRRASRRDPEGRIVHLLTNSTTGAGCQAAERPDGRVEVTGDRQLWSDISTFLQRWDRQGRPAPEHHRVHVAADGTHRLIEPS